MSVRIITGDALTELNRLPEGSVHCCVTSPPYYGLRDYGVDGQLGLEATPDAYVAAMVGVFREVKRVLRNDGVCFINIGDSYCSANSQMRYSVREDCSLEEASTTLKPKDLLGIPWMLAFALRADGWWLRQDIIWAKPNPMPESVTDRCTKAHEYLFLLSKSERYFYDADAIAEESITDDIRRPYGSEGAWMLDGRPAEQRHGGRPRKSWQERKEAGEPTRRGDPGASGHVTATATLASGTGRNKRSVWTIATAPFPEAHFATFPPALVEPCIKAGCPAGGTVLDPFLGTGTTALVADRLGRSAIGIELNPAYAEMARQRIADDAGLFFQAAK